MKRLRTILSALLLAALLGGCGTQAVQTTEAPAPANAETPAPEETSAPAETPPPEETGEPEPEEVPEPEETEAPLAAAVIPVGEGSGFTEFDTALITFLEGRDCGRGNFLVSPLSLRAALALAEAGAAGETRDALLAAMGFESHEAVADWYDFLNQSVESFRSRLDRELQWYQQNPEDFAGAAPDRAFRLVNSIWHNADRPGEFLPEYVQAAEEQFGAAAENLPGAELTEAVNAWANEETGGLIPEIAGDLSDMDALLVNVLYLRTTWSSVFHPEDTVPMDFTTAEGETVQKDFMVQQRDYSYYEDADTQLVVLPLSGNMRAAFVLGDTAHISEKLEQAEWTEVLVRLPKIEIETSLDRGELTEFLRAQGADLALTEDADFSGMSETPWWIQEIIQKSRIKTDEDGLEAAAATMIGLAGAGMPAEPPEPVEFTADRPFSFYLYSTYGDRQELLFFGQYLR